MKNICIIRKLKIYQIGLLWTYLFINYDAYLDE